MFNHRNEIVNFVYSILEKFVENGATEREFVHTLKPYIFQKNQELAKYFKKLSISDERLERLFYSYYNLYYNSKHAKFQIENSTSRPLWQYIQLQKSVKNKKHSIYADKVFRYDDLIWDKIYPPNGPECGCYVDALNEKEVKQRELQLYDGKDFEITVSKEWQFNPGKVSVRDYGKKMVSKIIIINNIK